MAPLRRTHRAAICVTLAAAAGAAGVAAAAALARPLGAPLGAAAVLALLGQRTGLIRWALLLLVAQLAVTLAGDPSQVQPLALLAAPVLVGCAELAFAAVELRAVPVEDPALLGQRMRAAAEAVAIAAVAAIVTAALAGLPLPHGAAVTAAGLLAAAGAVSLLASGRRA